MFFISKYIVGNSSTGELCLVFMKPDYSLPYAWSQISNVHVKYDFFGIERNIRIVTSPCSSNSYRQNVELILMCQGKTGIGYKKVIEACCFYKTRNFCVH